MATTVAWVLTGVFGAGFVGIWFSTAYRELSGKRRSMEGLGEQLTLHEQLHARARDGPHEKASADMLSTSRILWREGAKGYNELLKQPMNRIPALVLGFRPMDEPVSTPRQAPTNSGCAKIQEKRVSDQ